MKATTRLLLACLLVGVVGCHQPSAPAKELKSTYEDFEPRPAGASRRRCRSSSSPSGGAAFLAARSKDGSDLSITDIELQNVVIADGRRDGHGDLEVALATDAVHVGAGQESTAIWVGRGGQWLLESMQGGPYPDLAPRK